MNRHITGMIASLLAIATGPVNGQAPVGYGNAYPAAQAYGHPAMAPSSAPMAAPMPGQMMPRQMMPGQMMPGQMMPGQMMPGQMMPGQMMPGQMMPGQMMPGQMMPGQMAPQMGPMAPPPGVYQAAMGSMPSQGQAQLAGFGAAAGCDGSGCDSPGGCGLGGCGLGGCGDGCRGGLCGLKNLFGGCGNHTCGYDGYNSKILGHKHGPFGSGGCCLPRAYDLQVDWLFWTRDDSTSRQFSSEGILGPIVLDSNQLDYQEQSGYRVTAARIIHASTTIEATYFGGFNWSDAAEVTSNGNLFSVFSDFGSQVFNGIVDTDFANVHRLESSSELNNAELNFRHRWVSSSCLFHSSLLAGARYLRFREDLRFITVTDPGGMDYRVKADNDLVGAQIGGDAFMSVTPRFKFGGEIKAGVFGTSNKQRTRVLSVNSPDLFERASKNDVAFIGEAGLSAMYRMTPHASLRFGYQVLYVDGIATAVDNFNSTVPLASRDAQIDNKSNMLFHGTQLGLEFLW